MDYFVTKMNKTENMKEYKRVYYLTHADEMRERTRKWVKDHPRTKEEQKKISAESYKRISTPEKRRKYKLWHRYKITPSEYEKIFKTQKGLCAICFKEKKLYIDHCHKSLKVRGLLCFNCNNALGSFNDDVKVILNSVKYLKKVI